MSRKPTDVQQPQRKKAKPAKEILEHIYKGIVATPAFTLAEGAKVAVERFYAPEVDLDGELHCGFDVRLPDGSHLEFTVKHTGWGKPFAHEPGTRDGKSTRQR